MTDENLTTSAKGTLKENQKDQLQAEIDAAKNNYQNELKQQEIIKNKSKKVRVAKATTCITLTIIAIVITVLIAIAALTSIYRIRANNQGYLLIFYLVIFGVFLLFGVGLSIFSNIICLVLLISGNEKPTSVKIAYIFNSLNLAVYIPLIATIVNVLKNFTS